MPNWKKIIVSGSDASLSSLHIDGNLTASAAYPYFSLNRTFRNNI
jgi:hypothetical protein